MKSHRLAQSIVTRILLLGFAIVLLGTAVRYVVVSQFVREDLSTVIASQQLALANYVARDVDTKILQRRALLERLAATLPQNLLAQPALLRGWLGERQALSPLFAFGLVVVNRQGNIVADYPERPLRAQFNYADRDYIQGAMAGETFIGRAVMGRTVKEPMLPMATPIKDARGEIKAVLVGITPLATTGFLDQLLHSRVGESGGFLLISPRDHLYVGATEPELLLQPTPPPGVNKLHDQAMAGFRGTGVTVNTKGVEEAVAMVSVPSAGWFVVARLPTAEAFAPVGRIQDFILRNSVVVSLGFLLLAYASLSILFRPLVRAADHADRMTQGEAPLEPLSVERDDEVGHLTSAFNRLLLKLSDSQAELARAAHHDALTGLPNRLLLADRLQQALALAKRKGQRVALLFLDLDGFKPINDTLGHEAGDEILRQVARRLIDQVRRADTLARIGGDEFVLLLCDLEDDGKAVEAAATSVAAKCIETLATPFIVGDNTCALGVSIGIALGNGDSSANGLLLAADQAMYQAKEAGRGRYVLARG